MTSRQSAAVSSWGWAVRIAPPAFLVVLAIAGLRSAPRRPHWDGPLHRDGAGIGSILLAVLAALLVLTWIRHRAAARDAPGAPAWDGSAAKLRAVMMSVLAGGIVATVAGLIYALRLRLPKAKPRPRQLPLPGHSQPPPAGLPRPSPRAPGSSFSIPVGGISYTLLVLALIVMVVVSFRLAARLRAPEPLGEDVYEEPDPGQLREAVASGRSAMRALDDARAAIIACYLAMERSLAERGAARGAADTPGELLARATRSKIVRGTAAGRLTALFYEARFSSHPMDQASREEAERALDELAAALAARAERAERADVTAADP